MATVNINGSGLGSALRELMLSDAIVPGSEPGYQTCKNLYLFHPLGAKMVDGPISIAQSQTREITVPNGPEDRLREAFLDEWRNIKADANIAALAGTARTYGIGSIIFGATDVPTKDPIDPWKFADLEMYFNILDPLNTAGSLVLNQDPNAPDFQKHSFITASGQAYHRSRSCVLMNERPIYIAYTSSAFGYVGRSVYQRALYPLKSFIQSMVTDDMVVRKAGVLVAMIKAAGSIIDNAMAWITGKKRQILKEAETDNVISIGDNDKIETLDMKNLAEPYGMARKNILDNIAAAADEPAAMLNSETFAEGFGEGTEDAKVVARFIDRVRIWMQPAYEFFDGIVQYRAWNPGFYETIQADFPEYEGVKYEEAFYQWRNSFKTKWPSLLIEPESEQAKAEKVRLDAIIELVEVLMPECDPINKAIVIDWAAENFNEFKTMFSSPLLLDMDALREYVPPVPTKEAPEEDLEPKEPRPDAAVGGAGIAQIVAARARKQLGATA